MGLGPGMSAIGYLGGYRVGIVTGTPASRLPDVSGAEQTVYGWVLLSPDSPWEFYVRGKRRKVWTTYVLQDRGATTAQWLDDARERSRLSPKRLWQ